ncbi:hypothetical protein TYRP_015253 [Tyrophagus putrescentiae]|nr:hypothetical protein TYRP_015253 [Tyrophagus putrescentiae]
MNSKVVALALLFSVALLLCSVDAKKRKIIIGPFHKPKPHYVPIPVPVPVHMPSHHHSYHTEVMPMYHGGGGHEYGGGGHGY